MYPYPAIPARRLLHPTLPPAGKYAHLVHPVGAITAALLEGQQLQAIEFVASPQAHIVNKKISDVDMPKGAIAGAIVRNDRVIIPPGDSLIQPGDHVIIVSPLSVVHSLEMLLQYDTS